MSFANPFRAMRPKPVILGLGLALAVASGGPAAVAATDAAHSHGGAAGVAAALELQLDNGSKWATDEALRTGMAAIRSAMEAALPRIHAGLFPPAEFDALAERMQAQVDYVAENCKLPEAADHQLHLVLAQVLDGAAAMQRGADRVAGAVAILQALDAYGGAFDHPGWHPIRH